MCQHELHISAKWGGFQLHGQKQETAAKKDKHADYNLGQYGQKLLQMNWLLIFIYNNNNNIFSTENCKQFVIEVGNELTDQPTIQHVAEQKERERKKESNELS